MEPDYNIETLPGWGRKVALLFFLLALIGAQGGCEKRKGIWVECEGRNRTLSSLEKIDAMLSTLERHRFTDLYVQVYRRNSAWYASEIANDEPYRSFHGLYGKDPLSYMIRRCHDSGIRIHAWMNIFCIGPGTNQNIVKHLGPGIIIKDDRLVSMAEYKGSQVSYPEGTYTLGSGRNWIDPANLEVQAELSRIIEELLARYDAVDGIHLDFIRYPYALPITPVSRMPLGLGFGYNEASMQRFHEETGLLAPVHGASRGGGNGWDSWRREQVSTFVRKAHGLVSARGKRLSAAVVAYADRAYLSAFQDWRGWLEQGAIDDVVVMNYTADSSLARQISRQSVSAKGKGSVLIGLGAYVLGGRPEVLGQQVRNALEAGADGVVFFSYDEMLDSPELFDSWPGSGVRAAR